MARRGDRSAYGKSSAMAYSENSSNASTIERYNEVYEHFHFQTTAYENFKERKAQAKRELAQKPNSRNDPA